MGQELLTVSQAAEALGATSQTIRNWIRSERLRGVRIGNRFLVPREEVDRLRGDVGAQRRETTWDYALDAPPEPLPRKTAAREPDADPTEGLLGV
jgi:excisionase family DNA binding protein